MCVYICLCDNLPWFDECLLQSIVAKGAPVMLEILPIIPSKKFTHYSYFMLLSLPIILIKFFLAILHASSSGVARQ